MPRADEVLRAEVAAFAQVMSARSLAAALLDEGEEMLATELARLYRDNRAEVDRFASRQPRARPRPGMTRTAHRAKRFSSRP